MTEIIIDFFKNPTNLIPLDQKVVVHLHLILHQLHPCGGLVLMSSLMLTMIKTDYDWLLTPPGTPIFPSLEMKSRETMMSQLGTSRAHPTALTSRLTNSLPEATSRSNLHLDS